MKAKIFLLLLLGALSAQAQSSTGGGAAAASGSTSSSANVQPGTGAAPRANTRNGFGIPNANNAANTQLTPANSGANNNRNQANQENQPFDAGTNGVALDAQSTFNAAGTNVPNTTPGTPRNQPVQSGFIPAPSAINASTPATAATANQSTIQNQDRAISQTDRNLIGQVRQRLNLKDPATSASLDAIRFSAQGGTILVSGAVASELAKQNLISAVQTTPGVVSVMDQLVVNPQASVNGTANGAATGTISPYLQPASDPSLGDSHLHSSSSNQFGQRTYIPPARGTTIATNSNLLPTGSTNSSVFSGVTGTNVLVVPTDTNTIVVPTNP